MSEAVAFKNYSFTYAASSVPALRVINLSIERGEVILISGPSGGGKSTFLKSINGLIPHMYPGFSEGSVIVDGHDVANTRIIQLATKVGYVFQNPENQIFMFSVERDIAFGLENLGLPRETLRERVDWSMDLLDISHLAQRAPHTLSDGQKQRVALAGVLAMKPEVLILDEPTSLLDPHTASELVSLIRDLHESLGMTILIVEHRLDFLVEMASRILVLHEGQLFLDGTPKEVLSRREAMEAGVTVPAVSRVHNMLNESGASLGPTSLTAKELSDKLRVVIHDKV